MWEIKIREKTFDIIIMVWDFIGALTLFCVGTYLWWW